MKKRLFDVSVISWIALLILSCGTLTANAQEANVVDAQATEVAGVITIDGSAQGDLNSLYVQIVGDPYSENAVNYDGSFSIDATAHWGSVDLVAYDDNGVSDPFTVQLPPIGGSNDAEVLTAFSSLEEGVTYIDGTAAGDNPTLFVMIDGDSNSIVPVEADGTFTIDASGYTVFVELVAYDINGTSERYSVYLP